MIRTPNLTHASSFGSNARSVTLYRLLATLCLLVCIGVAPSAGQPAATTSTSPLKIAIIGDSTVANYPPEKPLRGWGQYLGEHFSAGTTIINLARNGRSSKTFYTDPAHFWQQALDARPDFIFIQFGHNDSHAPGKPEATRADGDFMDNLRRYVTEARAIGATPIFVTPMHRRTFKDGALTLELQPYADAMKKVGEEMKVPVVDLYTLSGEVFLKLGDEGSADLMGPGERTHFSEKGARLLAGLVAQGAGSCDERLHAALISKPTRDAATDSKPSGPVLDPAVALPDAVDKTPFPPGKAGVPTLFLCGDSTMDSRPSPKEPLINHFRARVGWGGSVIPYFDTSRINIENHAKGGTSTRTFMNDGYWRAVLHRMKPGDFVILEFGHNDSSKPDGPEGRGTLPSIGEETKQVANQSGQTEVVHTYGWYLRRFISDTESKGATPIILSPVPRNYWKDKTTFNNVMLDYTAMARAVADAAKIQFIDMNAALAAQYAPMGQEAVTTVFFTSLDKTHTSPAGAKNAAKVFVEELRKTDCPLKKYLAEAPVIPDVSPTGSGD